ncbi:serine/threonine protein kinase [Streptomyces sp. HMX87]|uniref:serine/threonine protein kinase n=1 Tax=Streptomyces sp. HMX87 TaxID=3390849 RepID=UPI003A8BAC20
MESPRADDPPRIGPYAVLARADGEREWRRTPERRYIAHSVDEWHTAMVCVPRADADAVRWAAEVETARQATFPLLVPVTAAGGTASHPWFATPYVPRLSLAAALAAHGGPLPEAVVRSLGAVLAHALATAHALDVTHAGLSPAAVLLGADGPRLACLGAVRAAAPDGVPRLDVPGLEPGCLAPEQARGGHPHPLGDVYALGAVLSYASTGHTVPERDELPASLRGPVTACLSRGPAARPSMADLASELSAPLPATAGWPRPETDAPVPSAQVPSAPAPTVLDDAATRGGAPSATPPPVPLPARVVAALARQSARILAAEIPRRFMAVS